MICIEGAHHRATGCPDHLPRKLVRTTLSNDDIPRRHVNHPIVLPMRREISISDVEATSRLNEL